MEGGLFIGNLNDMQWVIMKLNLLYTSYVWKFYRELRACQKVDS